jgi:DNA ligase (NAD+)
MDGEYLVCPNVDCPAQISGSIKIWVTKLGLKGWGSSIIDTLCDQGVINDAADLYELDQGLLEDIQMDGRKVGATAGIILNELHSKKTISLHVFVGSLGIPLCGRSTAKTIVDAGYDTLEKFLDMTATQIASIPGMGQGRAQSLYQGLRDKRDVINRLLQNGVVIQPPAQGFLKGLSVCMTGFRDADMARAIEAAGGTIKDSVSKDLAILVAKDPKSTSGKPQKARKYGVEIIGVEEMWERLK